MYNALIIHGGDLRVQTMGTNKETDNHTDIELTDKKHFKTKTVSEVVKYNCKAIKQIKTIHNV